MHSQFDANISIGVLFGEYTELGVISETMEVVNLSGYSPKNSWIEKVMNVPMAKQGCLLVHFDEEPMKGVCINYDRYCETYYDKEKQYICIGDNSIEDNDDCIEFANNIIAVLREGALIGVWAKIREIETVS